MWARDSNCEARYFVLLYLGLQFNGENIFKTLLTLRNNSVIFNKIVYKCIILVFIKLITSNLYIRYLFLLKNILLY